LPGGGEESLLLPPGRGGQDVVIRAMSLQAALAHDNFLRTTAKGVINVEQLVNFTACGWPRPENWRNAAVPEPTLPMYGPVTKVHPLCRFFVTSVLACTVAEPR
jgi:hypothetical protein